MKLSRYGLLGMTLVVSAFVLLLLLMAPKTNTMDASRRLAHLGNAFEIYCQKAGRMPRDLRSLVDEGLLPEDFCQALERDVKYVAAGRPRDVLSSRAIVALQDPAPFAGSIPVIVLLADGNVLAVPADVVRDVPSRPDAVTLLDSAPDGQLKAILGDLDR